MRFFDRCTSVLNNCILLVRCSVLPDYLCNSKPVEVEEEATSKHDTGMYGAVGDGTGDVPKKRMSLVERFGKMFEPAVVCSECICKGMLHGLRVHD